MVRIPSEYQEVEYLKNDNQNWIDTGIIIKKDYGFEVSARFESDTYAWNDGAIRYICGSRTSYVYNRFTIQTQGTSMRAEVGDGSGYIKISTNPLYKHVYKVIKDGVFLDDDLISTDFIIDANATHFLVFNISNNGSNIPTSQAAGCGERFWLGVIYYLKLFDNNGTIVRNLIPCYRKTDQEPGMYDTVSKTFFTNSGTGTFLVGNDVSYSAVNLMESRRRILLNTPHVKSLSGSVLSFRTDVPSALKECKIHFSPVQEGTGTPSPDNVRPITGWDGVTVTRCGKNLCPLINDTNYWSKNAWFDSGGVIHNSNSYVMCDYRKIPKNGTYFLSSIGVSWKGIGFYDESYNPLKFNQSSNKTISLTTAEGAAYYRVYAQTGAPSANIQLELGSTATAYEPYQATTLTIPFPQTVYGGYVDLVNGEVVEEYTYATIDGVNNKFTVGAQIVGDYCRVYNSPGMNGGLKNLPKAGGVNYQQLIADMFETRNSVTGNNLVETVQADNRVNYIRLQLLLSRVGITSSASTNEIYQAVNAWLEDNPLDVAYPLETPNTIPLTDPPSIPSTLRGLNNIISNANGNIDVSFYSH